MLLSADCVAYALGDFHRRYLKGKSLAIACPKLDQRQEVYVEKIRTLIDEGMRVLDFPAEPYKWEEQWTDQKRWHTSILLFNRTPLALLYRAAIGLRDAFRRDKADDDVEFVDPRAKQA